MNIRNCPSIRHRTLVPTSCAGGSRYGWKSDGKAMFAFDLHDRCLLAEKELARANLLLKTVNPGADIEALISGNATSNAPPQITAEQRAALHRLLSALCDNAVLASVGLVNDGRRVKRKLGTGDELIGMATIQVLQKLLSE